MAIFINDGGLSAEDEVGMTNRGLIGSLGAQGWNEAQNKGDHRESVSNGVGTHVSYAILTRNRYRMKAVFAELAPLCLLQARDPEPLDLHFPWESTGLI